MIKLSQEDNRMKSSKGGAHEVIFVKCAPIIGFLLISYLTLQMSDWRWMYLQNRTFDEYLEGLRSILVTADVVKSNQQKSTMSCPCIDCENITMFSSSVHVHANLIIRGFMAD